MNVWVKRVGIVGAALAVGVGATLGVQAIAEDNEQPTYAQLLGDTGAAIDARIAGLEAQISALESERDALSSTNATLNATIADLQSQIEALKNPPTPSPSASPSPSGSTTAPAMLTLRVGTTVSRLGGETLQAAYDRRTAEFGVQPEAVRVFYPGAPAWVNLGTATEVISFKYPLADVLAGKDDAALNQFFSSTPTNGEQHPWAYWHEPEDDFTTAATQQQYRDATAHIGAIAAKYDNAETKLSQGQIFMGWTANPKSGRDITRWLSTPKVSWLGWDIYPGPGDLMEGYRLAADSSKANGYPRYWITETGLNSTTGSFTPEQHAQFVTDSTRVAAQLGFRLYTYFDATVGGNWLLDTVVEQQAMGNAIRANLPVTVS